MATLLNNLNSYLGVLAVLTLALGAIAYTYRSFRQPYSQYAEDGLKTLEGSYNALKIENERLKGENNTLKAQIESLQAQINKHNEEIASLRELNSGRAEIAAVQTTLAGFIPLMKDVEEFHQADKRIIDILNRLMKAQGIVEKRETA